MWCKVAKIGENVFFFSQSENHFLNIPADILVSFPAILNIKGRQDFRYKTSIIFFYSENNSDSLNRPPNTNLLIVQCLATFSQKTNCDIVIKW